MGFLRRLLGGESDERAPVEADAMPDEGAVGSEEGTLDDDLPLPPDEAARAAALRREFDAGLTDLARRQLEFERYAWQPDSQLRRDGDWILMVRWKVQSPDGKDVTLKPGSRLTWVGPGTMSPGAVRFRTEKGVLVDFPPGGTAPDGWPEDLQRPRSPTPGGEEG